MTKYQLAVQRNVIGADTGLKYPHNVEKIPYGPVFDSRDSAVLLAKQRGWMDIWWTVQPVEPRREA